MTLTVQKIEREMIQAKVPVIYALEENNRSIGAHQRIRNTIPYWQIFKQIKAQGKDIHTIWETIIARGFRPPNNEQGLNCLLNKYGYYPTGCQVREARNGVAGKIPRQFRKR